MKRILSLILACTASLGMLTGCGSTPLTEKDSGKLKVVTTIFPEYDWVVRFSVTRQTMPILLCCSTTALTCTAISRPQMIL